MLFQKFYKNIHKISTDLFYIMNLNYSFDTKKHTATIVKSPNASGDIVIPTYVYHNNLKYKVIAIGQISFQENMQIESITFENDSKTEIIDESAFNSSSIKSIVIPKSVKKILSHAFAFCQSLTEIRCEKGSMLQEIGHNAFSSPSLTTLIIPNNVGSISSCCLYKTWSLTSVELLNGPRPTLKLDENKKLLYAKGTSNDENYDYLLFAARDIRNVVVHSYIKHITSYAFEKCKKIQNFIFEENSTLNDIGYNAFAYSSIEKIAIPSSVTLISMEAFNECDKLKEVKFENDSKLTNITSKVFHYSGLKSMIVPSGVQFFQQNCFSLCFNLSSLELLGDNVTICDGFLYNSKKIKVILISNANNISVQDSAFKGASKSIIVLTLPKAHIDIF